MNMATVPMDSPAGTDAQHSNFADVGQGDLQAGGNAPILVQYWHVLQRWKWVVLGLMVAALAAGVVATLLATPQFTATTRIEINREQQNVTNTESLESPVASGDDEFYQTQYSNLAARSLATRVVQQLRLANSEAFFAAHGADFDGGLLGAGNVAASAGARQQQERFAVDLLLDHVTISPITRSRLVDISYTSANADLSATISNAWAEQFIASTIDRRFASSGVAREFLEGRLAELQEKLEDSERAAVTYAANKNIVALSRSESADGKTVVDRTLVSADLEALNTALAAATAERVAAQSRAQSVSSTEDINNPSIAVLRQRRAEAQAEYARLMVQFEPGYPKAQAVQEQIQSLDGAIAQEQRRIGSGRTSGYREALARENDLKQRVASLKSQLTTQNRDQIQYNIFQREADTNRQLYDSLLQRYKEIGVAGVAISNISVVDRAIVPGKPSSPNLMLNLALALVGGLGLSFLALIGLEQMDEGLRDPTTVSKLLNVPLLGSVPEMDEDEDVERLIFDAKSGLAEAYFSIQSNLSFTTATGFPKTLMTTSARPAEGKSTSSVALAAALGRTGKKVLLLDADMRSPSCHEYFDIDNEVGLSNLLTSDKTLADVVHTTPYRNLSLVSAGPTPPSAAELLSGDRLREVLDEALLVFDHVIVDSPPLLGLADAPLISRAVEGAIFAIEMDGVAVRGLRSAIARLRQAHPRIFGAIVTKVDADRAGYGDGYGYGYGYGQKAA